jgi:pilus assembly protein Flp/PilA
LKGVLKMVKKMKSLFVEEEGQGMTEYGLVLGVIAVAVIAILATLKNQIVNLFNNVVTAITGAGA